MDETNSLLLVKGAAILGSAVLNVVLGLIPLKIVSVITHAYYSHNCSSKCELHRKRWSLILCGLSCFSGGIFLGTCMLSMLPELQIHFACWKRLVEHVTHAPEGLINYPWPEFTASMGFFFVFFIEELTLFILKQRKMKTKNRRSSNDNDVFSAEESAAVMLNKQQIDNHDHENKFRNPLVSECGDFIEPPSRPHPHSHIVRTLLILSTLSYHTIIESMSYAFLKEISSIWKLFWTTSIHQAVVAFALGMQLSRTHRRNVAFVITCICIFSLSTPIGFLSGLALDKASEHLLTEETVVMILEGLAIGAFLYVTFYEVLSHELNNEHSSFFKLVFITIGCFGIAALNFFGHDYASLGLEVH